MPGTKGHSGGARFGNPSGKRGRPPRPTPPEITSVRVEPPLPCSIRHPEDGICGRPATEAYIYPHDTEMTPGAWLIQPMCRQCMAKTAALYEQPT